MIARPPPPGIRQSNQGRARTVPGPSAKGGERSFGSSLPRCKQCRWLTAFGAGINDTVETVGEGAAAGYSDRICNIITLEGERRSPPKSAGPPVFVQPDSPTTLTNSEITNASRACFIILTVSPSCYVSRYWRSREARFHSPQVTGRKVPECAKEWAYLKNSGTSKNLEIAWLFRCMSLVRNHSGKGHGRGNDRALKAGGGARETRP